MDAVTDGREISAETEARTVALGREIFALARAAPAGESWWDRKVMAMGMADEAVKAQLFRLVDVLPVLSSPEAINRHLREYMGTVRGRLPWVARGAMRVMGGVKHEDVKHEDGGRGFFSSWFTVHVSRLLSSMTLKNTQRMARRFIAASDAAEAVAAARNLRARRWTFTIDLLGEAVLSATEALAYQKYYLDLIETLAREAGGWSEDRLIDRDHLGPMPRVNVSVKLSSLFSQFDPIDPVGTSRAVRERLRPVLRAAKERGVFVNFDMEQHAYKDVTIAIFREVLEEAEFREWGDVGIAIQAYLRSSGEDLRTLANWASRRGTPVSVRLVKGAYWDYERIVARQNDWPIPVYDEKPETDANYEEQARFLIERFEMLRPAIASHNIRSIAAALAYAEERKLPRGAMEFQLLYGMADPIKTALVKLEQRVRVYAPVGALLPGMAYLVRRLLENTSNESFLRAGFAEGVSEERLLMNPTKIKDEGGRMKDEKMRQMPPSDSSFSLHHSSFRNEPLTDFSTDAGRKAMSEGMQQVWRRLGGAYPLVIDGKRIETGAWIESMNPSHKSQLVGRVAAGRVEQVNGAVAAAKRAFPAWRDTPVAERVRLLRRLAEILRRRRFEFMAWEVYETGKQWREADGDVAEAIDYCEYYAREMERLSRPWGRSVPGEENVNVWEPRGVAVVIAPWNFPLAILLGMTTAALVSGNTVVMKPSEQSAVVGAKFIEALEQAGFPPGVVNLLNGIGEEVGPALVGHPDVAVVAFTGSRAVGLAIQKTAAEVPPGQEHLKRVITELGGKNAVIVDEDADLDEAVHGVVASAFGYAGQKCSACSRVIVMASIYDAFVNRLVEATKSLKVGPAEEPGNFVGPVIDGDAQRNILDAIERGKGKARFVYGGGVGALADEGFYVAPHVFADVPPDSPLAQEEIFGPVLSVLRAKDLAEGLAIANGVKYALTGGLFSRSPSTIERVRREFRVGNLYINRKITGALVERQPFGGFKLSGVGTKAGGPEYLQQFMWPRTVTENTMRRGFTPPEEGAAGNGQGGAGGI
jgi:RHH-type proline utilization regulon transcriptional repressor/proline dehydrogenase/delta 1-pyrroline-5-carboxylate dehydrogenase